VTNLMFKISATKTWLCIYDAHFKVREDRYRNRIYDKLDEVRKVTGTSNKIGVFSDTGEAFVSSLGVRPIVSPIISLETTQEILQLIKDFNLIMKEQTTVRDYLARIFTKTRCIDDLYDAIPEYLHEAIGLNLHFPDSMRALKIQLKEDEPYRLLESIAVINLIEEG